jgi:chlorobactene glucosyltransferase
MDFIHLSLGIGAFFIGYQLIVFIRNTGDFTTLPTAKSEFQESISILIPARNEELSIRKCVTSAVNQHYSKFEIVILDDHSTDATPEILAEIKKNHSDADIKILSGEPKPDDWLGKNWACHQLAGHAKGNILIFIDADTQLEPGFIASINSTVTQNGLDALTVWPKQILESFWEKVVIPQMYYVIYTILPIKYSYSDPSWMPKALIPKFRESFAAACGQCMVFKRSTYDSIGGHSAVRKEVVEDVMLARLIRRNNFSYRMYHGRDTFSCRMYSSEPEIVQGFRKNFLAGFGNNILFFVFSWVLHIVGYILPWISLPIGYLSGDVFLCTLSAVLILLPILIRLKMDRLNQWEVAFSFLHLPGVLWFNRLAVIVMTDRLSGRKVNWKNRSV